MKGEMKNSEEKMSAVRIPNGFCLHLMNDWPVIPKICINSYECRKCAFDQWLEIMDEEEIRLATAAGVG